jgi:hypothetical protein
MSNTTPTAASLKIIAITATFPTVLEALEASGIDIEYNPASARQKAKELEQPNRHFAAVKEAWLCEDGEIRFIVDCADGLRVLNTFDPFISCLDDSDFTLAIVTKERITFHTSLTFPKSMRKALVGLAPFIVS